MSWYKIQIQRDVLKSLKKLNSGLKRRFELALKDLLDNPFKFKLLRYELKELYSARISRFRIIYQIEGDTITIYADESTYLLTKHILPIKNPNHPFTTHIQNITDKILQLTT